MANARTSGTQELRPLTEEGRKVVEFHDTLRKHLHQGDSVTALGIDKVTPAKRRRYDPTKLPDQRPLEDVLVVSGTALDRVESVWLDTTPANFRPGEDQDRGSLYVVPPPQRQAKKILVVGAGAVATRELPAQQPNIN